jgi:hypothetical protein
MTRGHGPTSHTADALIFECKEGEPSRKERTVDPWWRASSSPPQKTTPDARQGDPVSGMGARAHESCSLGVGLHVRRRRTAA